VANLSNTPRLTPGFRAAQLLTPPLPFEILCFCGILAKEYILVSILGFFLYGILFLYVAVYDVLYCFAGLGCWSPGLVPSSLCWFCLLALHFLLVCCLWFLATRPSSMGFVGVFPTGKPVLDSGCLVVVAWMLFWYCLCKLVFLLVQS